MTLQNTIREINIISKINRLTLEQKREKREGDEEA
jgi:hypothetical protein